MDNTINPHVFHEFYLNITKENSNNFFNTNYFYNRYPLITNDSSIAGGKVIFGRKLDQNAQKPIEFEDKEEALKFYKIKTSVNSKGPLEESEYNILGSDVCKNYFEIPETDFHKYKNYFNGMIKSCSLEFKYQLGIKGEFERFNDCPCSSSSSSSSSSGGCEDCHHRDFHICTQLGESCNLFDAGNFQTTPFYVNINSSTMNFQKKSNSEKFYSIVEGPSLIDIVNIANLINNSSSSSYNKLSLEEKFTSLDENIILLNTDTPCESKCFCPPCDIDPEEKEEYKCKHEFFANLDINLFYDGSKIFELDELENRANAYNHGRCINFDWEDDDQTLDALNLKGECGNLDIYKDNWIFNPGWKSDYFKEKIKFEKNSTLINDPIFYNSNGITNFALQIKTKDFSSEKSPLEIIESQKNEKKSENLGLYSVNINAQNMTLKNSSLDINFSIEQIFYIKKEKSFLCFVELDIKSTDNWNFYINEFSNKPDEYILFEQDDNKLSDKLKYSITETVNFPSIDRATTKDAMYTTKDKVKLCEIQKNCSPQCIFPSSTRKEEEYQKEKINLIIDGLSCEFEVFSPKNNRSFYKIERDGTVESNFCEDGKYDLDPDQNQKCNIGKIEKNWSYNPPIFRINSWQREDFSKDNIYPPKVD